MTHDSARDRQDASDRSDWAVVCDFDGTAIYEDIADALSKRYLGEERWQDINRRFERGDISFRDLLHELFEPIAASPEEIHDFAKAHAHFRPGFVRLMDLARDRDVPFILASGGLDIYIRPALELLPPHLATSVALHANHAEHREGGLAISFPYDDAADSCGTCGSCKGAIVRGLQRQGYRVIAIGDGNADRCMARVADRLYARDRLQAWCDQQRVPYTPFETLDIVADALDTLSPFRGDPIGDVHPSIV
jgi:2-hydroxy-3-keto-5-methylthiopentenyl-1-phosphate phosphatase